MSARILIVDDEEIVVRSTVRVLESGGYALQTARDGAEALQKVDEAQYDVVILDVMMPNMNGLEVLRRVKEAHPDIEVIMFTGLAQIETAVNCMKLGAFDYLAKPFDPEELRLAVTRALERRSLRQENLHLKLAVSSKYRLDNMIGSSARMQQVYRLIAQCAATNTTVLITGESGTGKELIARAHPSQQPAQGQAVRGRQLQRAVGEPARKRALRPRQGRLHRRGVATRRACSRWPRAGTLFLDEIGNIPLSTQAKLLRVIQEREFRAVGDTRTAERQLPPRSRRPTRTWQAMSAAGAFRDDLYYRINVFPIHVAGAARSARGHPGARVPLREVLRPTNWARTSTRFPRER